MRAEFQARDEAAALEAKKKQVVDQARLSKELGIRVALVIGNSVYQGVPLLPNPQRDLQAVAEVFKKLGFQTVMSERNLSRAEFLSKLREFEDLAVTADWAVVFYAGHGLEMDGVNYLLPIDVHLLSSAMFRTRQSRLTAYYKQPKELRSCGWSCSTFEGQSLCVEDAQNHGQQIHRTRTGAN